MSDHVRRDAVRRIPPSHQMPTKAWLGAVVLATLFALTACAPAAPSGPAAAAVQNALELRRDQVKVVARYAPLFSESAVATALADAAKAATSTVSPVPAWETPYLSAQGTSTADVVVLWTADAAHKGWAAATLFALQRTGGRWLIVDAQDLATGKIPKPLKNK